jgi:electron transport complex protein RnfB
VSERSSPAASQPAASGAPPLEALVDALDAPQTQCTRCGYPDCRRYAEAIAAGEAEINQCPPGGEEGVQRLALISGRPALPLNPVHGLEGPRQLAVIDEAWCIGCTLCLDACPVDAIVGGTKRMHTVINDECTGCELCIPVCPVDCIALVNASGERTGWAAWDESAASRARERYAFHRERQARDERERRDRLAQRALAAEPAAHPNHEPAGSSAAPDKKALIAELMARARAARKPE